MEAKGEKPAHGKWEIGLILAMLAVTPFWVWRVFAKASVPEITIWILLFFVIGCAKIAAARIERKVIDWFDVFAVIGWIALGIGYWYIVWTTPKVPPAIPLYWARMVWL